ncbi:putative DNA-binding transcriptional regulator AlpA [Paraburkholderia atlantica]|uniref:helix-turn-helix transcriptional regulator n=1 Tax=Paraburkholderia atlantica TaxID=2654982 RepID=UPI003D1B03B7
MANQTLVTTREGTKPAGCFVSSAEMPITLPDVGLFRFKQFAPFLPFSRETWRKLVLKGKAPAPIRMGERCTVWPAAELHKFLRDPANYQAENSMTPPLAETGRAKPQAKAQEAT